MKIRREFTLPAFQYDVLENDKDPLEASGDDVVELQDFQSVDVRSLPSLRVIAVAAPDRIKGQKEESALNSRDPASLFNACRIAASRALSGRGPWGESNWAKGGRNRIRRNFLLMYSLDDMPEFVRLLKREKPNVILLGAMSLCMPGAIECARVARQILGRQVLIVLGGRHANETIYLWNKKARQTTDVLHHAGSPARLMRENRIPPLFDAVISGEAEYLIAELGEVMVSGTIWDLEKLFQRISPHIPGNWIVSLPMGPDIVSAGVVMDPNDLPPLAPLYGVSTSFDVFGNRMTAHVFSDTGAGCVYDCDFCSERSSVTGRLADVNGAPQRLYRQMAEAVRVIREDHPGRGASAFIEDSVLLGGSPRALDEFCDLLDEKPLALQFGAQLTIDLILRRENQLRRLATAGLRYLFIGLETFDPNEIGGMSKNIGARTGSWNARFCKALDILSRNEIACGCALLFGLGETHNSRIALLDTLIDEKQKRGSPVVLSANWAVQHPLQNSTTERVYDYTEWGTPPGGHLSLFHHFGEASLKYCMSEQAKPRLEHLREIVNKMTEFEAIQ
jgi:B12-binding domain/radical SAM domain protein